MSPRDPADPGADGDRSTPAPDQPLPPGLDPRGRAHARRAARAARSGGYEVPGAVTVADLGRRHGLPPLRGEGHPRAARGVRFTAMGLVALLSLAVIAGTGYGWDRYRELNQNVQRIDVFGGSSGDSGVQAAPVKDIDGAAQNILLVGSDDRSDATPQELAQLGTQDDGGSINADTTILIHVPADGKNAVGISFPRDSYVPIADGYGTHKLNSAYPDGYYSNPNASTLAKQASGAKVLIDTIENLTGLKIDHYASVDLLGFYRISNALGGVQVNLCEAQQESDSGINLPKGVSTISGTQALAFVRQRHDVPGGDLGRIKRQQYFLTAAFRKVTSAGILLSPSRLQNLIKAVDSSIVLDKTFNITQFATQISSLSANNINFQTIPTQGDIETDDGDSLAVDPGQVQAFVQKLVGASNAAGTVSPKTVSLEVSNASGQDGLAATTASTLGQAGFTVTGTDTADSTQQTTTVEYPVGSQRQASTVANYVPGAKTEQTGSVTKVTLVLGTDGKKAIAKLPVAASAPAKSSSTPAAKPADQGCIN